MGMFDYVVNVPPVTCPRCGNPLDGWQTKDLENTLDEEVFRKVDWKKVNHFHTICSHCKGFVDADRKPPVSIDEFVIRVTP